MTTRHATRRGRRDTTGELSDRVQAVLTSLERHGRKTTRDEMLSRYGITAPKAFGVPMATMQKIAKAHGKDHDLALALWETGWYEARTVAAFVDEPTRVTAGQMDRWCRDVDNWAICDTVCFHLFDRTPHAMTKVDQWSRRQAEYQRRAAFALLACVALHGQDIDDDEFLRRLPLIEQAAADERNFVRKAVSWSLRSIGRRRSPALRAAARALAERLAASSDPTARWIGKDAMKALKKRP